MKDLTLTQSGEARGVPIYEPNPEIFDAWTWHCENCGWPIGSLLMADSREALVELIEHHLDTVH